MNNYFRWKVVVTKAGRWKALLPICGIGSQPTSVFIDTPSVGDRLRLKSLSLANETDLSRKRSTWYLYVSGRF